MVFGPTILAYFIVSVDHRGLGLALYGVCVAGAAYPLHLFESFRGWPAIAKVALVLSPVLVGSGLVWPAFLLGYWIMLVAGAYGVLTAVAGFALNRTNIKVPS